MSKFCTECGAKLKDGQKFCTECGTKLGSAKSTKASSTKNSGSKKGLIIAISVVAVLLVGLVVGVVAKSIYDSNKRTEFKEDVTSLKSDVFKSFQDAESVGNQLSINLYVYTATSTNKYARYKSPNEAISAALTSKASEVAKVNSEKPGLDKRYKKLMDYKVNGDKAEEIKDSLKEVYTEYENVYKAAIKPVGTPTSIMQDYKEARAAFTIKYSALNQLLTDE